MKVKLELELQIDDSELPIAYLDVVTLDEVLRENVNDVFLGSDIPVVKIERLTIDIEE